MSRIMTTAGEDYLATTPEQEKFFQRRTASIVGLSAFILPIAVIYYDQLSGPSCRRESISHYFYAPDAGQFFVVLLAFIGGFFLRYKGERPQDAWAAKVGCLAALCVAFFPTGGIGCLEDGSFDVLLGVEMAGASSLVQLGEFSYAVNPEPDIGGATPAPFAFTAAFSNDLNNTLHKLSALVLFLVLGWFSFFAFRRVNAGRDLTADGTFTQVKRVRNALYLICAAGMALGAVIIGLSFAGLDVVARPVFVGEAVFLTLAGVSWLIKGRFLLFSGQGGD
ncbi:MAG: hypothetical protein AAFP13_01850 [Pseudomonadota bacterium]